MSVDLSPILSAFGASDIVVGVISVAATLCGIYICIFGVMNLLILLRGGEAWSWGLGSHLDYFENKKRDDEFRRRHKRERKDGEYREWKKKRGF